MPPSPRPHTSTMMMRCTMLSLLRSRLALPTSLSSSTTLPPPSTTSTTAGARPITSWMDLTRLSSPPRQPSRLPTARTSAFSGRNARPLCLSATLMSSRHTRLSRQLRKSRRSLKRTLPLPSILATRGLCLRCLLSLLSLRVPHGSAVLPPVPVPSLLVPVPLLPVLPPVQETLPLAP
ncbi:hypothetical protein F5H01DRAFT_334298 [Linnemannia elongata]|nr:hypothetical protein F5H01DRAFT_334298 [Linnemannia elongata]